MDKDSVKTGFTPENIVYTPKNILSFISELVSPWKSQEILDPACGSGSFFWNINEKAKVQQNFTGIDIGPDIVEMAKNNLETFDLYWRHQRRSTKSSHNGKHHKIKLKIWNDKNKLIVKENYLRKFVI